ncbi:MAG: alpha/beta hydrolase [Candidatus Nomurabacteria bacterium]
MKILVNNNIVNYKDIGDENKPVVVFLHGWLDNLSSFKDMEILQDDFRLIFIDLPGFGESVIGNKNADLSYYVDCLNDFLKKINVVPYTYVGHSFGGRILIKGFGLKYLNSKKIILIGSAGIKESISVKNRILFVCAKILKILLFPFKKYQQKFKNKLYNYIGSDYTKSSELNNIYKNIISEDLQKYAKNISVKTLLIYGDNDKTTPISYGKLFNKLIKDSRLVIIKDAGHFTHMDKKSEVIDLIKSFLIN